MAELANTALASDANLLSYYRLEGNSNDSKGALNGSDTNITYNAANGKFNQGAGFNGSSSKISLGDNFDFSGDFSVVAWVKVTTTAEAGIVTKGKSLDYQWQINSTGGGKLECDLFQSGGAAYLSAQESGNTLVTGSAWHHVAMVHDLSPASLKLYLNGVLQADDTTVAGSWNTSGAANCLIGGRDDGGLFLNGSIDDVGIFNRILTAGELLTLATDGTAARRLLVGMGH